MNSGWMQAAVTVLVNLLLAAYVYGQLAQRQKDQGGWLKRHDTQLDKHGEQLTDHEGRISYIEGRKEIARE